MFTIPDSQTHMRWPCPLYTQSMHLTRSLPSIFEASFSLTISVHS